MELYTNTVTASTPSFGMPVVAASPRVAPSCAQLRGTGAPITADARSDVLATT